MPLEILENTRDNTEVELPALSASSAGFIFLIPTFIYVCTCPWYFLSNLLGSISQNLNKQVI